MLSEDEARSEAAGYLEKMHDNLQYLKTVCEVNGTAIFKRWKNKSSEKRKALLLEVDPDMYPRQWANFHLGYEYAVLNREEIMPARAEGVYVDPDLSQGNTRRPHCNIFLLPYMNLESLKDDPGRLLNIVQNRVKYSPEQWAYDNYLLDKQWRVGTFATVYNNNCIVMHGFGYGKLTSWDKTAAH